MIEKNEKMRGVITFEQFNTVVLPNLKQMFTTDVMNRESMDLNNAALTNIHKGNITTQGGEVLDGSNGFTVEDRQNLHCFLERMDGEEPTYTKVPFFRVYAQEQDDGLLMTYQDEKGFFTDMRIDDNFIFVKPIADGSAEAVDQLCEAGASLRVTSDGDFELYSGKGDNPLPVSVARYSFAEMFMTGEQTSHDLGLEDTYSL